MKIRTLAAVYAASLGVPPLVAEARPVSYPGGWTVMQQNSGDASSLHIHYSPTFSDSIRLYAESNWANDWRFAGLQYNRLIKRWNMPSAQANAYFKLAAGGAQPFGGGDTRAAAFVGFATDWETRRWFLSYETRAYALGFDETAMQSARVGIAPYVGDYGDVHTWLMLEAEHQPEADEPVTLTPIIRLFYGVQLLEFGYTPATEAYRLNYIIRF